MITWQKRGYVIRLAEDNIFCKKLYYPFPYILGDIIT